MKSYNRIRIVVELELPCTQGADLPDIVQTLEDYTPRLREDMDDFCERLEELGHDGANAVVSIESATVHYEER